MLLLPMVELCTEASPVGGPETLLLLGESLAKKYFPMLI